MGQEIRRREQGTIQYKLNSPESMRLGRGMIYRELYITLEGQPTLLAANNTQAKTLRGDEWAVVKRIDIIVNNTQVIRSFSGNDLWWLNYFLFGAAPPVTPAIGDGATANPSFASTLIIPFWMPRCVRPITTALDARQLSDLKIEITWGTYTDINADATAWTVEPTVKVESLECFNLIGNFSQWRIFTIEKNIAATNPQYQVDIPVGPAYRGFMMGFTDAGKDSGSILNSMKIVSGATVYGKASKNVLRQVDGWMRNKIQHTFDGGAGATGAYDALRRGTTYNSVNGMFFYDHVTDGYLTESIDTLGLSEFKLELDVVVGAGTTKAFILPMQIIPIRTKK